jgi:DNA processing protein
MTPDNNTRYYLGFNLVPGIGPTRLASLIEVCGSVEAAWHASTSQMMSAGLDKKSTTALLKAQRELDLDARMEQIVASGIQLLSIEDADYPALLAHTPNAPPLLYVRGALTPADDWAIGVVGTRSPTTYGKEATRAIVNELARNGITVVSGLAMGIDSIAHKAALEADGRTIAVLGCGVDIIYPERNQALAEQIMENGAIISDYPLGTRPMGANFPPRNRIISGLSRATLVTEAGEKSGALITVEFALEQGRDVFAVPGSIFSPNSSGVHRLIRNGAALVSCAQDILEELHMTAVSLQQEIAAALPEDPAEAALLQHLSAEPQHIDALCRASGQSVQEISATLAMLELKGYVRQVGTMEFVLVR